MNKADVKKLMVIYNDKKVSAAARAKLGRTIIAHLKANMLPMVT